MVVEHFLGAESKSLVAYIHDEMLMPCSSLCFAHLLTITSLLSEDLLSLQAYHICHHMGHLQDVEKKHGAKCYLLRPNLAP